MRHAVIVVPGGRVAELAEPIRHVHDTEWFERVPPHVTLLNAFEPHEGIDAVKGILEQLASRETPFVARTGGFGVFFSQPLVLFIKIEDERPLIRLQRGLGEALPNYDYDSAYRPHITCGRFASEEALVRVLGKQGRKAEGIEFEVNSFALYAEDEGGVFRLVKEFPFAHAQA